MKVGCHARFFGLRARCACHDSKTGAQGAKQARVDAKTGSHVHSLRVLRPSSTVQSLIRDGSMSTVVWASSGKP